MNWDELPDYNKGRLIGLLSVCYDTRSRTNSKESQRSVIFMTEVMIEKYELDHCFVHDEILKIKQGL